METCAPTVAKYLLFVFNLLFALSGLALVIGGALTVKNSSPNVEGAGIEGTAILFIVVGVFIFVIAFFGCCGAIRENRCMLITFAVILGVIFIVELAGGIAAAVAPSEVKNTFKTSLTNSLQKYYNSSEHKKTWDTNHKNFECCGVDGKQDWGRRIPDSCCPPPSTGTCTNPYNQGCYERLKAEFKSHSSVIAGLGIGLAFLELIGIFMACCLAAAIKKEEEEKQVAVLKIWTEFDESRRSRRQSEQKVEDIEDEEEMAKASANPT